MKSAIFLLCLLIPPIASAQWGAPLSAPVGAPGIRRPVIRPIILPRVGAFEWREYGPGHQIDLWKDGRQIGAYDPASGVYRPLLDWKTSKWGEPCEPPVDVPEDFKFKATATAKVDKIENFGLDLSKLTPAATPRYLLGGKEIDWREAYEFVEKGLPDDRNKLRFTVIGTEAERKPVWDAWLAAENADLRDKMLPWFVAADHWSVKDLGFAPGHPAIYTQSPDGKVLGRAEEYKPEVWGAIRKAVADYDSRRDPPLLPPLLPKKPDEPKPDDKKPLQPSPSPALPEIPLPLILLGGAAVLIILLRRNSNAPA